MYTIKALQAPGAVKKRRKNAQSRKIRRSLPIPVPIYVFHDSRAQKGKQRVAIPLGPEYQLYLFRERSHMPSTDEGEGVSKC